MAWVIGQWRGVGELNYPGIDQQSVQVDLSWTEGDGPFLDYRCVVTPVSTESIDQDESAQAWSTESGFWRISPEKPAELDDEYTALEVMTSDPAGRVSIYLGAVGKGRITVASDLIARTATAAHVTASRRMFGLVSGQLMWVWELAAFGHPMQSYLSVAMDRVSS